jgi:hypothetical protein
MTSARVCRFLACFPLFLHLETCIHGLLCAYDRDDHLVSILKVEELDRIDFFFFSFVTFPRLRT